MGRLNKKGPLPGAPFFSVTNASRKAQASQSLAQPVGAQAAAACICRRRSTSMPNSEAVRYMLTE